MSQLPQRDGTKPTEQQGLFQKFIVTRTDGKDTQGQKHSGCEYFVLDIKHDKFAKAALTAYAAACAESHPDLKNDLVRRYALLLPKAKQDPVAWMNPLSKGIVHPDKKIPGITLDDFDVPLYTLPPDLEALRKENERLSSVEYCFNEWLEKTDWVQKTVQAHELGMHRADVLKNRIDALRGENKYLKAEAESFRRMLIDACHDLGLINEALGLDPDDGGAEPILDAIAKLKGGAA